MSSRSIKDYGVSVQGENEVLRRSRVRREGQMGTRQSHPPGRRWSRVQLSQILRRLEALREQLTEEIPGRDLCEVLPVRCVDVRLNVSVTGRQDGVEDQINDRSFVTHESLIVGPLAVRGESGLLETGPNSGQRLHQAEDPGFQDGLGPHTGSISTSEAGLKLWGLDWDFIEGRSPGAKGGDGRGN